MMNAVAKFFLFGTIFVLAIVGGYKSYWATMHTEARFLKLEALLVEPAAHPDPWTGTNDNERTIILCSAIMVLAHDHEYTDDVYKLLPKVCR